MALREGKKTILIEKDIRILSAASIVSKKEGEGPLRDYFDVINNDMYFGEESWEKAESILQKNTAELAIKKASLTEREIDICLSGDLLNQCIGSAYGLRGLSVPFLGLYGACSTFSEGLGLASVLIDSGAILKSLNLTSSHFCSSERQFRFPLEYGGIRPPSSQWTVTGSGAVILGEGKAGPRIKRVLFGEIQDLGITDINNMGAAMAPAAADTIAAFFEDTGTAPSDYDLIATGDLGSIGSTLLYRLLDEKGIDITSVHSDCGLLIFDTKRQDVHAGGSGCGCSASVFCSYIYNKMLSGKLKRVLLIATGALMSPTATNQKESIPSVAHLVEIVG